MNEESAPKEIASDRVEFRCKPSDHTVWTAFSGGKRNLSKWVIQTLNQAVPSQFRRKLEGQTGKK